MAAIVKISDGAARTTAKFCHPGTRKSLRINRRLSSDDVLPLIELGTVRKHRTMHGSVRWKLLSWQPSRQSGSIFGAYCFPVDKSLR